MLASGGDPPWLYNIPDCAGSVDSRFAPSQWKMALLCNAISHWLDASLESALCWSEANRSCVTWLMAKLHIFWTWPSRLTSWHEHAFCNTGPLWGETTRNQWILFIQSTGQLCRYSEQALERTTNFPMIWDAMAIICCQCNVVTYLYEIIVISSS